MQKAGATSDLEAGLPLARQILVMDLSD